MEDFIIVVCFISFIVAIGLIGLYILLKSPSILKMDKEKNSCTKETKYVWQKKYKIKTLCKLSEVQKAYNAWVFSPMKILYLKLRSGKDIIVFSNPGNGRYRIIYTAPSYDSEVRKINNFLKGNGKKCIIKHSLSMLGFRLLGVSLGMLPFIIFVCFYE